MMNTTNNGAGQLYFYSVETRADDVSHGFVVVETGPKGKRDRVHCFTAEEANQTAEDFNIRARRSFANYQLKLGRGRTLRTH